MVWSVILRKIIFVGREAVDAFSNRHPMFVAALVAATCVLVADQHLVVSVVLAGLFGLLGWLISSWRVGIAWAVSAALALSGFSWRTEACQSARKALMESQPREQRACVLKDTKSGGRFWSAPAVLLEGPQAGVKVWWNGRGATPVAGSVVRAKGNFNPLPIRRNPGAFDQATWMERQGIAAVYDAAWADGEVVTGAWSELGAKIRRGFRAAVTDGLPEDSQEAAVIRAVVIGEQPPDADALVAAFRNSGTLHAFSVSGLHVAMVGSIGWLLLKWIGVPRRWAVPVLLPLVFGYAWLTGNSAPAERSAWMAAIFLGAFVARRRPDLLNALGAVLLVATLWDGRLLFQPGVQLSYGVVAAIAIGTGWSMRGFAWLAKPELYLPISMMSRWQKFGLALRKNIAQSLGVSLAAGIGSTPLTAYHFGLVTPISVFAGVIFVPMVFVLLCAALLAASLHPIVPVASRWVNQANGVVAKCCVKTAEGFSAIPGGHFQLMQDHQPFLLVYDLEHGAGAACFSGGQSGSVLIDCGDRYSFKRQVMPSLRRLGVPPDSVVLTHPDGGHLGGGSNVWEAFPIQQVLLPVERSRSPAFRSWASDALTDGIRTIYLADGDQFPMPAGARLEVVLAPDARSKNLPADDRVAIFRLHWQGWKILFTSDAGISAEQELLDAHRDISADVIIAGMHREQSTLNDAFLDAVNPQAIIASHADFPLSERRKPESLAYWRSRGIQPVHQGQTGGVTLRIDPSGDLRIEGFVDRSLVVLKHR